MGRTSTTFKRGHPGFGGRPKGTPNGAGRNAWRLAAKQVADLAMQIDAAQSTRLAELSALTPTNYLALYNLVGDRQKNYEERSQYRRALVREGGLEVVYPGGVTNHTWKKAEARQSPSGRKAKPVVLSDRVGRRAADKVKQLHQDTQRLLEGFSHLDFTITRESADSKARLTVLRRLIKVERDFLRRSEDPRPVVVRRAPFRIVFNHIPSDPLHPEYDEPLRMLGGRRPSEIWTAEEIRASRKHGELESGPIESRLEKESEAALTPEFTSSLDQNGDAASSTDKAVDDPTRTGLNKRSGPATVVGQAARAEIRDQGSRMGTKVAKKSQAKEVEPSSGDTDESFDIRDWVIVEDTPTPCCRCSGRGRRLVNQTRPDEICSDCNGTGWIYDPRNQGSQDVKD
jgi:hypothetical protein